MMKYRNARTPDAGDADESETSEGRREILRGEELLADLAMKAEARRADSPLYSDEQIVAWLDREASSPERSHEGWSADRVQAVAARIQAKVAALRSRVRQVAGAPRVEPARITGTVPRILADAAAVRAAPQVDLSAAAGVGRDIWDEPCESWVPLPEDVPDGRYIAVRVAGDSMTPLMHTGDTILVKVGDQIARDSIVLAKVPDAGYVVKRVGRVTPSHLELLSLNAAFPPIDVRRDARTVVGTVVLRWCSHGE